ncbi:MAG TPA: ferredoxin--NADP reductase [Pseudonocardiaceae bacterium]|nr:ferredoxin--NADP reductase [Pseudonocardiaceae bacterium]
MPELNYHQLRVAEVVVETDDARSLVFALSGEQVERFRYRPGQFLTLRIPSDERGSVARCYSLSSSPLCGEPTTLKVTVKRTPDGYASNWIHANVVAGMALDVLPPGGVFSPKSLDEDFLCFAAGSGITPVMSIVKSALAAGSGRVVLVYANRDERSVIFRAELAELVAAQPERLTVIHWLESVQGLPTVPALRELARPFTGYEAFVCGPAPFMDAAMAALDELAWPRARTHVERFLSLVKNPFLKLKAAPIAPATRSAVIEVELDGTRHTVPWPVTTRLLDALRDAGLPVPSSCEEGRCSACACLKLDGDVTMVNNEVLDARDLADGYILACQSLPASDKITITYD